MAKNDTILLDGIIAKRIEDSLPSKDKGEVFEYFAFEQILKDYDLSADEINFGWVDGENDGGIDGLFLLINGTLLTDAKAFSWPKANASIELFVITSKHHDTYELKPVDSLCASVQEFFDLSIERKDLKADYASGVLDIRTLFYEAYQRLAVARPSLSIKFVYASRGDSSKVGENIENRANQVVGIVKDLFSSAQVTFTFVGASELISRYRKEKAFSIKLPVAEHLSSAESGYVVLSKIDDYTAFVTDESGSLRRYLFDSNVRDYLGKSSVNVDILASLKDANAAEFWWLNNGVTILTTNATLVGKMLHLDNIQIVNGLQTTETLFQYRNSPEYVATNRCVLIKAIVSTEASHRDQIIKATNNQNVVETAGLRATDKVQRDIEEYLDRFGWYYERRKNYYKNVGKPAARFVTPLYLASAVRAILHKAPQNGVKQRAKFMRNDASYREVFSESTPLPCWRVMVEAYKAAEFFLQSLESKRKPGGRFITKWRGLLAFISVAKAIGRFSYDAKVLAQLDPKAITPDLVGSVWTVIEDEMRVNSKRKPEKRDDFTGLCCERASLKFGILHLEAVYRPATRTKAEARTIRKLAPDFVSKVRDSLPEKPWPPELQQTIAEKLGCELREVQMAISIVSREQKHDKRLERLAKYLASQQSKITPPESNAS